MNESKVVVVAQPIPQDIADKVNKEMVRREYAQRLGGLLEEITKAGFYIEITHSHLPDNTFTRRISLRPEALK